MLELITGRLTDSSSHKIPDLLLLSGARSRDARNKVGQSRSFHKPEVAIFPKFATAAGHFCLPETEFLGFLEPLYCMRHRANSTGKADFAEINTIWRKGNTGHG